jgi:hypothetical protein
MGMLTDMRTAQWQREVGIELPPPARAKILYALSGEAVHLIKLVTLELSGIRDGDGRWCASNPLTGMKDILDDLFDGLDESYRVEHEKYWAEREAQRNGEQNP